MEPAGRYFRENFSCLVKPKVLECKDAFYRLGRTLCMLFGALCFALAFTVVALNKKKEK